jgi:hypothetical protein
MVFGYFMRMLLEIGRGMASIAVMGAWIGGGGRHGQGGGDL